MIKEKAIQLSSKVIRKVVEKEFDAKAPKCTAYFFQMERPKRPILSKESEKGDDVLK